MYEDTLRGYDRAKQIADAEVEARLRLLSAAIDTQGDGIPLTVFNMLGWPRTDIAVADVDFAADNVMGLGLAGPEGKPEKVQLVNSERKAAGGLRRARNRLRRPRCSRNGVRRLSAAAPADACRGGRRGGE